MRKKRLLYCFRSRITVFYSMSQECWQKKLHWSVRTQSFVELDPKENRTGAEDNAESNKVITSRNPTMGQAVPGGPAHSSVSHVAKSLSMSTNVLSTAEGG